jgi:predicted amidohydrolase
MRNLVRPVAACLGLLLADVANVESAEIVGRPVRIVTLSFAMGEAVESIAKIVDREAAAGVDLIVLPESWTGKQPEPLEGPATRTMAALAHKHHTYLVSPIYRKDGNRVWNSAVLLDRNGEVAYVYDKICPVPTEYQREYRGRSYDGIASLQCGSRAAVVETDFGKLGLAVCFDISFPEIWQQLAEQGAELVAWPSAYPGGLSLQAHAINHHYYIVSATHNHRPNMNCPVVDITGKLVEDPGIPTGKTEGPAVARFTLDLDRRIYSHDFAYLSIARRMVAEHPGQLEIETYLPHESWFVLRALKPGVQVRKLAAQYGLREVRESTADARADVDCRRGQPLAEALRGAK